MMTNRNESAGFNLTVPFNYDLSCLDHACEEFDINPVTDLTEDEIDAFYFYKVRIYSFIHFVRFISNLLFVANSLMYDDNVHEQSFVSWRALL